MTPSTPARNRIRVRGTVAMLSGIAATAAVAGAVVGVAIAPAAAAGHPAHRPGTAVAAPAASAPVVIDCAGHAQTKPRMYILACADAGAFISAMSWANWGSAAAFGSGTYDIKVCVPSCVAGHLATFPALAALWRAESLPGHAGVRYFTRMTLIFTGNRAYKAGSKTNHLPATLTFPLSASGGA
jgi:hypothetical protein